MKQLLFQAAALALLTACSDGPNAVHPGAGSDQPTGPPAAQLGPRPFYLVEGMQAGALRDALLQCGNGPFFRSDFSIAHRGAPLQFPEHSDVGYRAAARMGAGIVECDVTFTLDGELVCRHSECDLATTTNIVATPLNDQCTVPWTGPVDQGYPAPECCTSDLTVDEFKTLEAKMDASDPGASTPEGYLGGTADWRTDLYTGRARVLTFEESIALNEALGVKHAPELKSATHADRLNAAFGSQQGYAQAFIDTLRRAGVNPENVFAQSFRKDDVLYWIQHEPEFGRGAVYLEIGNRANASAPPRSPAQLRELKAQGINILAPTMSALLTVTDAGQIVPTQYARDIRAAGLEVITWTFERDDLRHGVPAGGGSFSFDRQGVAIKSDGDMYKALDVLARDVGIRGMFSDWPATVTYYANCMGLE